MQFIDFNAIKKNTLYFKKALGNAKLCAVVKNNAYGHGIEHVARYLSNTVDYFAVGSADEASQISYLNKDTLILLPQDYQQSLRAIKNNVILTLDSFVTLDTIRQAANSLNMSAKVHIKIDSGMTRLGFDVAELPELVNKVKNVVNIDVLGVYSHFWGENRVECDKQLAVFLNGCALLENGLHKTFVKHIANTSATLLDKKYHLDMARVGLGIFGYGNDCLLPAKRVVTRVMSVKQVKRGSVVGYGGKYVCANNTQIATLELGYAQGLPRTLCGADVIINGNNYKIVAICMAMCMVDVGFDNVKVGDEATVLGENLLNASRDDVIIYELLCGLH